MAPSAPLKNVAIIGVTGNIGEAFTRELLKTGKHNVTALTRKDSKAVVPEGVNIVKVDYDDEASVLDALKGQQFLIITLGVRAPPDLHEKIVRLADKAGVQYIMPNLYGYDPYSEDLMKVPLFARYGPILDPFKKLNASSISLTCGYWYEWSLGTGEKWFGFDIKNRKVTFYDDGNTKINTTTWDQCGRAIAALLSLPESGASPSLETWKDKVVYISSWKISQRDMLDSLHRVLGTTDKDWVIAHEPAEQRYHDGLKEMQGGDFTGFAKAIYARIFHNDGVGDYESTRGLANDTLGLPKEDLDEYTKKTVEMVEAGWDPMAQRT